MASDLPGPTKRELGMWLGNHPNDPHAPVPREHLVLALACLELFGGEKALAYYCGRLVGLRTDHKE
jgi:hypothetical protein